MTRYGFVLMLCAAFLAAGCTANHGDVDAGEDAVADDAVDHGGMDHGDMDHGDMDGHATNGEDGKVCGGIRGLPCDEGQFCELEPGSCQSADLEGVCVTIPEICTKEYRPVCGCDGNTYGNDCMRRAAAVQKDHDGEC